jgi:hypothetical protein
MHKDCTLHNAQLQTFSSKAFRAGTGTNRELFIIIYINSSAISTVFVWDLSLGDLYVVIRYIQR